MQPRPAAVGKLLPLQKKGLPAHLFCSGGRVARIFANGACEPPAPESCRLTDRAPPPSSTCPCSARNAVPGWSAAPSHRTVSLGNDRTLPFLRAVDQPRKRARRERRRRRFVRAASLL